MTGAADEQTDRDTRLDAILGAFYDAAAAGAEPDRLEWVARHPEFAAELAAYFVEQDDLFRLAAPVRAAASEPDGEVRVLGDYELIEELARGGMGVVYKARQRSLNRPVALKLILAGEFAEAEVIQRFRAEAEAVALLDHPNIVPIYEVGSHRGQHYFSMKLYEGGSLADRLGPSRFDPRTAAQLVATVARAVHHAHQHGILHRDLKPSNILLDADGEPHVADFGLAKRLGTDVASTRSGALVGSPPYMAPEQIEARPGAITTATDVYGLGAILYTLLMGRPPFIGDSPLEILEQIRTRNPDALSRPEGRIDRDLETICLKCLEKDSASRYASAQALGGDLDRWLRGEPITARHVGRLERALRWCRRNPVVSGLSLAVAGLAVTGVVGLALAYWRVAAESARAELARRDADRHFEVAVSGIVRLLLRLQDRAVPETHELRRLRRDVGGEALVMFQDLRDAAAADPRRAGEVFGFELHIAHLHFILGDWAKADAALDRAVAAIEPVAAAAPDEPGHAIALAHTLHVRGLFLQAVERPGDASPYFQRAAIVTSRVLALKPNDLASLNHSAWFLAICPDRRYRDPERAIALARRAIALEPGYGGQGQWMNLGAAQAAAGRWREAVETLGRSMDRRRGGDAFEWFHLAMAHAHLGAPTEARRWYDRAVDWMDRNKPVDHELILFRREAARTLGLPPPPGPWPSPH